jgi:hypothetical protein
VYGPIEVQSWHVPGGPKENHVNRSQNKRWLGRDSNRAPPERKCRAVEHYRHADLLGNKATAQAGTNVTVRVSNAEPLATGPAIGQLDRGFRGFTQS